MSGDYISREAAKDAIYKTADEYDEYDKCDRIAIIALNNADDKLNDIPAADVVEVVRCRECKHSLGYKFPYNYERVLACNDPRGMTIKAVNPMHFCSYGERKDGGLEDGI